MSTEIDTPQKQGPSLSHLEINYIDTSIIVCLDNNIEGSNKNAQHSITLLHPIATVVKRFADSDECVDYLSDNSDQTVFLVISDELGREVVPVIHQIDGIKMIYVIGNTQAKNEQWVKEYGKVKGVFSDMKILYELLKRDAPLKNKDPIAVSFITSISTGLDRLNASFMFSQLLKETVLQMIFDNKEKDNFIRFYRNEHVDGKGDVKFLMKFDRDYQEHTPAYWYTSSSFIFDTLNKALRIHDVKTLTKMGFFIADLDRQLRRLHMEVPISDEFVVYRGQGMLNEDFAILQKRIGGLIAFNNFLSTSTDENVALAFAQSSGGISAHVGVLFEMKIDPTTCFHPFASLSDHTHFAQENEILFSMHAVFRIDQLETMNTDGIWRVKLTLTDDNDEQLQLLTEHMRKHVTGQGIYRLGCLLLHMKEWQQAKELYDQLLDETASNDLERLSLVHNQLGVIIEEMGDLNRALYHYQQSLEIKLRYLRGNDVELSATYSNIASILTKQGCYSDALQHLRRIIDIEERVLQPNFKKVSTIHKNIGKVLMDIGKYDDALRSYKKCIDINRIHFPSTNPSLADTYTQVAHLYILKGDLHMAKLYYEDAIHVLEPYPTLDCALLARTHYDLANTLERLHKRKEAIVHGSRAVEIARQTTDYTIMQTYQQYLEHLK